MTAAARKNLQLLLVRVVDAYAVVRIPGGRGLSRVIFATLAGIK
jgi:hypothetical protein